MIKPYDILNPAEVAELVTENGKLSKQVVFLRISAIVTFILLLCIILS